MKRWIGILTAALLLLTLTACDGTPSGFSSQRAGQEGATSEESFSADAAGASEKQLTAEERFVLRANQFFAAQQNQQQVGKAEMTVRHEGVLGFALQYPQIDENIDRQLAPELDKLEAVFSDTYRSDKPQMLADEYYAKLYVGYAAYLSSSDVVSVVLRETYELQDGSRPVMQAHTYQFQKEDGRRLEEADLFQAGYRTPVSQYVRRFLMENPRYSHELARAPFEQGTAPVKEHYNRFALTEDAVVFYFDRGSVLPPEFGVLEVAVPFSAFGGTLRLHGGGETPSGIRSLDPARPMVALTFDDGPHGVYSDPILDVLARYNAVATFFEVGNMVRVHPEVVQRAAELGCELGSHTYDHADLRTLTPEQIAEELEKTNEAFRDAVGFAPRLVRPPYGGVNGDVKACVNYPMIMWSVDTLDWKTRNAQSTLQAVINEGDLDGKVILMHSIHKESADAVELVVPYLLEQGYQLVTVSELAYYQHGDTLEPNRVYGYEYFQ